MQVTLTLPTLSSDDRAAVVRYLSTRVVREPWRSSPAGQAGKQILTAIGNGDPSIVLDLSRGNWGSIFNVLGNAGRETSDAPAATLKSIAEQINTADRTANPALPLLQNS